MKFFQAVRLVNQKRLRILSMISTLLIFFTAIDFSGKSFAFSSSTEEENFSKLNLIEFKPPPKAPAFVLKDLGGKEVRVDSFQGKPMMLYFWATW